MWDGVEWETIGPTPPSAGGGVPEAPIDGQIYARQNGAWVVASTSMITFSLTQPVALTIPASTWAQTPYSSTPGIDTQVAWDAATYRLIPKKAGVYLFEIRENSSVGAGGSVAINLIKNDAGSHVGGVVIAAALINTVGALGASIAASGVSQMNGTTDFVRVWAYTSSGTISGAGSNPIFTATLLA
jgi:hypothetical protein